MQILQKNVPSILVNKKFLRLQDDAETVHVIGFKGSCSSVWCPECYTKKGGSKRFSDRLGVLDWKKTRQVVLTVDPEKFASPQDAYEKIKENKSIPQLIHNLKRTEKISISDWCWVLEWHRGGFPHWHLFIETDEGKKGMIGNECLLKHWHHGLIFESWIKSEYHWKKFTEYFGRRGYFNPKEKQQGHSKKDKTHQTTLPQWALQVRYRIRKTGSKVLRSAKLKVDDEKENDDQKEEIEGRTYDEILKSCGQTTYCRFEILQGKVKTYAYKKINISYKHFREYGGDYIPQLGHLIPMTMCDLLGFLAMHDFKNQNKGGEKNVYVC